ncbi:MAG: hypothetical protein N3A62_06110 [Thermodesulfovibrionales bacterium]|nr:hypothetical protein [Thermodesulfovibrionales bacterium]
MKTITIFLSLLLILISNQVWSITTETPLSEPKTTSPGVSQKVQTTTVIIKKIDGNTIHTNAGTYNISGANVVDLTKDKQFKSGERKTATLTFIDGRLVDVVIK